VRHRLAQLGAVEPRINLSVLLHDVDFAVAETAAWSLGERVDVTPEEFALLLEGGAHHDHAIVRESCIAALGAIGDPRAVPVILEGCNDKPAVRRRAILALAPFDGPEVTTALEKALLDRDWQVRQAAEDLLAIEKEL
jgi:HEAT repeat protein